MVHRNHFNGFLQFAKCIIIADVCKVDIGLLRAQ